MAAPKLYNFHQFEIPDPIPELLTLLNIHASWDPTGKHFRLQSDNAVFCVFPGGTVEQWTKVIERIVDARKFNGE